MEVTEENYFEVAEALHCWLTLNHKGQWSDEYAALCRSEFRPGRMWSETICMAENVYCSEITEGNWREYETELNRYMNERD